MAPRLTISFRTVMFALAAQAAVSSPVFAQAGSAPRATDSRACAPADRLQADPKGDDPQARATTGENLSDKLARTDGVICPPNVGPDMRLQAPETGTTPVIPPPGAPGGDPTVRPK